jgi:hypothetical protein
MQGESPLEKSAAAVDSANPSAVLLASEYAKYQLAFVDAVGGDLTPRLTVVRNAFTV